MMSALSGTAAKLHGCVALSWQCGETAATRGNANVVALSWDIVAMRRDCDKTAATRGNACGCGQESGTALRLLL